MDLVPNWYILFVCTGKEEQIVQTLKRILDTQLYRPFIFAVEKSFKRAGKEFKEKQVYFPGYIFIESRIPATDFISRMTKIIWKTKDIYRILNYGNAEDLKEVKYMVMHECEVNFFQQLFGKNNYIEMSNGIIEGNSVQIKSGALIGKESHIKKINRHKREAIIEAEFMGEKKEIKVGLEIISKIL